MGVILHCITFLCFDTKYLLFCIRIYKISIANNHKNQQKLAGMVFLTIRQELQTYYLSMHSGIQHGMQHRKPVAQNKIAPQASAVPPTFVLSITPEFLEQNGHAPVVPCCNIINC